LGSTWPRLIAHFPGGSSCGVAIAADRNGEQAKGRVGQARDAGRPSCKQPRHGHRWAVGIDDEPKQCHDPVASVALLDPGGYSLKCRADGAGSTVAAFMSVKLSDSGITENAAHAGTLGFGLRIPQKGKERAIPGASVKIEPQPGLGIIG
jgi:hypothetical protein